MNSSSQPKEMKTSLKKHPEAAVPVEERETKFLAGLRFMLRLFYEGVSAEDIKILFENHNQVFAIGFVSQVVGGDIPTVTQYQLDETEQREAEDRIDSDINIFQLILQLNREGKDIRFTQKVLEDNGYYLYESFIKELIMYEEYFSLAMVPGRS